MSEMSAPPAVQTPRSSVRYGEWGMLFTPDGVKVDVHPSLCKLLIELSGREEKSGDIEAVFVKGAMVSCRINGFRYEHPLKVNPDSI